MTSRAAEFARAAAWSTYLMAHTGVEEDDDRRTALDRYIINLCESGEQDPIALQKAGLAYLHRLDQLGEEREERLARYHTLDRAIEKPGNEGLRRDFRT
ncbi:hypothetical protein [Bradyrhizobium iriomotense]|uniref:hypothetical protein n=1 Tax=Bradyrhizobium iriomotense TaxID=441950 RepID=UPI001B8A6CB4|nr:hypothetical protein [Bradyrhizobium iriomotense]MBR1128411.1 hypothetical protein [Bradyrhizobium iriomotense]